MTSPTGPDARPFQPGEYGVVVVGSGPGGLQVSYYLSRLGIDHAVISAELPERASGVLYCIGGISAGFTVYMDEGFLKAEYNAMTLNRFKVSSDRPLDAGAATIEVDFRYDSPEREGPATVTFTVDGEQVGQGRIGRSVPGVFTASETFDVGMDLGSPVSLDYHERAPFAFDGTIEKIHIRYPMPEEPADTEVVGD